MFKEDDKEVKEIIGRVIHYFMKISFDDLTIATTEMVGGMSLLCDRLIESAEIYSEGVTDHSDIIRDIPEELK